MIKNFTHRIVKFSSVYHLTIHIPKNFGNETTKVYYIGLRGEFTSVSDYRKSIQSVFNLITEIYNLNNCL